MVVGNSDPISSVSESEQPFVVDRQRVEDIVVSVLLDWRVRPGS